MHQFVERALVAVEQHGLGAEEAKTLEVDLAATLADRPQEAQSLAEDLYRLAFFLEREAGLSGAADTVVTWGMLAATHAHLHAPPSDKPLEAAAQFRRFQGSSLTEPELAPSGPSIKSGPMSRFQIQKVVPERIEE